MFEPLHTDPGATGFASTSLSFQEIRDRHDRGTVLLYGAPQKALDHQAALLAATHLCLNPVAGTPCSTCDSCHKIRTGNHPDAWMLAPENGSLKIADVRSAIQALGRKGYLSNRRALIIERLQSATLEAANALLKLMEEPPDEAWVIASAISEHAVLETLRSRSLPLRVTESSSALWHTLAGGDADASLLTARFGNPVRFYAAAEDGVAELSHCLVEHIAPGSRLALNNLQKELRQKASAVEDLPMALEALAYLWLSPAGTGGQTSEEIEKKAYFPYNVSLLTGMDWQNRAAICQQLAEAADEIRGNSQPGMALENWIIEARRLARQRRA